MGLDVNGTQCVLYAKTLGVDFARTATIGRQGLHLRSSVFRDNLVKFGFSFSEAIIDRIFAKNNGYADEFFRSLGAKEVHSFDNSNYEGATYVHDLNNEIPGQHKNQYSVVLDGGSLEHIFNFPQAIKNCMEMAQVGGHFLGITPANKFVGHGFYQFSPELFYSIFTPENGYEMVQLIAFENDPDAEWFSVKSPISVRRRVVLANSKPVYLLVIAQRVEMVEPFRSMPQQSDYVPLWNSGVGESLPASPSAPVTQQDKDMAKRTPLSMLNRTIPKPVKRIIMRMLGKQPQPQVNPVFNPAFFQPVRVCPKIT